MEALPMVRAPQGSAGDVAFPEEDVSPPWRANDEHMVMPKNAPAQVKLPWKTPPTSPQQVDQALGFFNDALRKFDTKKLDALSQTFFGRPWANIKQTLLPFLNVDF
jgi:hypothetical protein